MIGFDTGTANTLLDAWYLRQHPTSKTRFDRDGLFAKKGDIHEALLKELLSDPYFQLPFPKSTGREYFSLEWLLSKIGKAIIKAEDVQRTLIELTTYSISDAIKSLPLSNFQVIACGGGMHNQLLLQSLGNKLEMKDGELKLEFNFGPKPLPAKPEKPAKPAAPEKKPAEPKK